jgi:GAF domain-containing protein/HAMP domain-containing protein
MASARKVIMMSNDLNKNQARSPIGFTPWASLTYPQKFTLVALIFALSLLAFLPMILEQNERIENYGRKEAQGNTYLDLVWNLSTDLQSLHIASIEIGNQAEGQSAGEAQVDYTNALFKVEADILALESANQQYAEPLGIDRALPEIISKWSTLKNALQARSASEIEAGFTSLESSIDNLIKETGDKSYLILDPDLDTYYLMDTVLLNMPENKALMFKIWQISNEAAINKDLSSEKQFELSALISQLKANLTRLEQNLQTSIANNPNGEIEPIISQAQYDYLASIQSFINLVNTYLSDSQANQLSPVVLKASYAGARAADEAFYTSASQALGNGIETRIQFLSLRLSISILLATLSILVAYVIGSRIMRGISLPLLNLLEATQRLTTGDMNTRLPVISNDEAGQVAKAFNILVEEVKSSREILQLRAMELERRSTELEAIAEVARDISVIRDLNTMLSVASSLIRERFDFHHTGIYLMDERNEYLILRAASGPSSQALLEQGFKLKNGGTSVIGSVAQTGQAQIAMFSEHGSSLSKNILLPETKSEIGFPLRGKSLIIGVLDIQSSDEKAFTKREIQIFQILADQLSAAIDNAQLVQQVEGTINQLNVSNRIQTKRNWDATLAQQNLGYEYDGFQIQAVPQNLPPELMKQLEDGKPIILKQGSANHNGGRAAQNTLMVPLLLSGQVIGVIGLERDNPDLGWTNEEISIAEAAANRAAITLENARLLEESQRRALKERTISESTARISTALSVENILSITAEELERVIGDSGVVLQIKADDASSFQE